MPSVSKSMSYPFLYIRKLTTTELEYLAGHNVIRKSKLDDSFLPIYLKPEDHGYRLLGYTKLCFSSIISLNCLRQQQVMIKNDKDTECDVVSLLDSLLLT